MRVLGVFSLIPFHSHDAFHDFFALQHPFKWHILSVLWGVLMFCPFKHVIWFFWCSPLTLHLFSCNAFIWWQFFIESPKVFSRSCLELIFFSPLCLEMFDMWPSSSRGSGAAPVLPTSHLGISACRAHFPAFRIPGDSIREQFSKANEEKNPQWCFRLWTGFVWLWGGFQKPKIKGILGCQRAVLPYSPLVFLFLSQKQCSWSHFKWELSFGNIFRSFSKSGSVLWGKHWWEAKVWRRIPW